MWFNLKNAFELETFRTKVAELENRGAMVELKEKRGRSLRQNAYLHLLLSAFGLQYGYTLDEVKTHFYKLVVNKDIFLREGIDKFTGEYYKYLRSSADLTKDEMSKSISDFKSWAKEEAEELIRKVKSNGVCNKLRYFAKTKEPSDIQYKVTEWMF